MKPPFAPAASPFVESASKVVAAPSRHPRQSLLHGVVYGVPVRGPVVVDQRPNPSDTDLALGLHGDDLAAVLASAGLTTATAAERRGLERLLAAFTGQVLASLGTPNGAVAADEHEHQAGFSSRATISPRAGDSGISKKKREPWPGCDSTPMAPPINSTCRLVIARPKPVPPFLRPSAPCWKGWNRSRWFSGEMPFPVSRISN